MNCRPGDLAVMVCSRAGNEGALVRIVGEVVHRLPGWCAYGYMRLWHVEGLTSTREGDASSGGHVVECPPGDHFAFPDAWLRPLRDPGDDATDETLLWLPAPTKETA